MCLMGNYMYRSQNMVTPGVHSNGLLIQTTNATDKGRCNLILSLIDNSKATLWWLIYAGG